MISLINHVQTIELTFFLSYHVRCCWVYILLYAVNLQTLNKHLMTPEHSVITFYRYCLSCFKFIIVKRYSDSKKFKSLQNLFYVFCLSLE